jgi:integrase/recombinase XerD
MKIHLRQRKQTKDGSISLFLEIYRGTSTTPDGKVKINRSYEYLNLYLIEKPKSPAEKQHNKETKLLAERVLSKRILEIENGRFDFHGSKKNKQNFIEFFKARAISRGRTKEMDAISISTHKLLIEYGGNNISFDDINEEFCEGFLTFLTNARRKWSGKLLSTSSVSQYFLNFKTAIKKAAFERLIPYNPCEEIFPPKVIQKERKFLTLDELRTAAKTDCKNDTLKRAFLFSCLTGLRWSDVSKLKWSNLQKTESGWKITFHQQKTKGLLYLDISEKTRSYLGKEGSPEETIFFGLHYSTYLNFELSKWLIKAGIEKDITFHCARHTFSVLQLTMGTKVYTLSKLLGHTSVKTTEIYSNITDDLKIEAANKIPDLNI